MNFLAHAYLSFNNNEVLVGNMISDFVKGKSRYHYIAGIQNGIELHRRIDGYTDTHPVTKKAQSIFQPVYRLYGGVFTDIIYDHFLALDTAIFTEGALQSFSKEVYAILYLYNSHLPVRFSFLLPYMEAENWLYNYQHPALINKSFAGLARRSKFLKETDTAFELFTEHYSFLQKCYVEFFPDLQKFAQQQFKLLVT